MEGFDHLGGPGYVEGNAWQYLFFVPHDMAGLAEVMGGWDAFAARLDETFEKGHFVLWNEPDMAYPFLFNYAKGEEWRTQKWTRDSIARHFSAGPGGLPGNDDAGTLSSWLVFAMMGIYPDCPGSNRLPDRLAGLRPGDHPPRRRRGARVRDRGRPRCRPATSTSSA